MDATLVIIGVNFHTAPLSVRERFWIPPSEQVDALRSLVRAEGIEEVVVLSTCARTEFILWASDPTEGANSVLRFLTRKFDLKLSDWSNFYRLVDHTALLHLFRIAAGLDCMTLGDPEIVPRVSEAWRAAREADTSGRFLDAILQKTLDVSTRVRSEIPCSDSAVSIPFACVELGTEVLGPLAERSILLLGAGKAAHAAARYLQHAGARNFAVVSRTTENAQRLAGELLGRAVPATDLLSEVAAADLVVAAASSASYILRSADIAKAISSRQGSTLLLVDLGLPRNVDPDVRSLAGVFLYNLDDLERLLQRNSDKHDAAVANAEKSLSAEAQGVCGRLLTDQDVPTIVALRRRLEEICGQELRTLEDQFGPFTEDQQQALHSLASHITQRIAGGMARQLNELPAAADQEQLTEAVQRLFHLQTARGAPSASS